MARKNSENLRREYNKMIKKINKQLKVLEKHDPNSVTLTKQRNVFTEVTTPNPHYNSMKILYNKAKSLLDSNELSLDSQKRAKANAVRTLREEGIDYVNNRNFNYFMKFLEEARQKNLLNVFTSEQLIEAINIARNRKLTKSEILDNIDRWARKNVKFDKEGKQKENLNPSPLNVRRINKRK